MTSFRRARAAGSRTKRRRSLILTSLSKMVSAAAFTSATNPCWSRAIAGRRIALSAAGGEETDPCAPATAAISIKRRVKEERIRSSSARRLQTSEFMSQKFILTPGSLLNTSMTDVVLESRAPGRSPDLGLFHFRRHSRRMGVSILQAAPLEIGENIRDERGPPRIFGAG